MKRPKERLYKVIVIGATPEGVIATNKLGELGIPVALIDPDADLDEKLAKEEWRLDSGMSLNYAHRSGLLRILRNPVIRLIMPAEVESLKHTTQGFRIRGKALQTFVDPDRCTLCGRCFELCPVTLPGGGKPIKFLGRTSLRGRPVIDKRRQPPCQEQCPLGVNAQGYIALARAGEFQKALDLIRRDNVLPGICGRVCTHPCETACRRGELDEPIAIKDIKRFVADYELSHPGAPEGPEIPKRARKVAVIGSGPAGLAASADLARLGYQVTVFEKESMVGGLLRYGIGAHRLPRDILDHDLEYIKRLGVQFKTSHPLTLPEDLETMKKDFHAVVLAIGTWADRVLGVAGEDLQGVEGCISFLSRFYRNGTRSGFKEGEKVAVIGDGNAAFDLARVLKRSGVEVTILSWFPHELLPADSEEVRGALDEGINLVDRTRVIAFSGKNGRLDLLHCKPTQPGDPDANGIPWPVIIPGSEAFTLKYDRAIVAIGQTGSLRIKDPTREEGSSAKVFDVTGDGLLRVDASLLTAISGVYAAGDAVSGPSSVVEAMAAGRAAARSVHRKLSGEDAIPETWARPVDKEFAGIPSHIPSIARPVMPERQAASRRDSFAEVALGLSELQVLSETERCLQCGVCSECLLCTEACGEIGAINHKEPCEEFIEHAGAVIIADPKFAPPVRGEDVIRAYGPKATKSDVYAMVTRGFAAAAQAMILLGGASLRPKGRGVSFSPPDPQLSPEIRLGVFACRCNDAYGWHDGMDEVVAHLRNEEDMIHVEVIPSACVPEGAAHILRVIREKGLTRVVLASCVCCPLDFVCCACTEQRTRLKEALFKGTGVSRSMVETCNIRGEALRHLPHDASVALERFKGLIERSVHRARRLKSLPTPARIYNFSTAVIGESEAALSSAMTLADAGLEVFLFGGPEKPLSENLIHPNIHCFTDSKLKGVSGTIGNFQIFVDSHGFPQTLQVGAVILGEKSRHLIPYLPQKGLPSTIVASSMQKKGVPGIPFLYPGSTSIAGLYLANPPGIHVSERQKGAAAAVLAASVMPRGPRQSRGYTVVVDKDRCRGCGRCIQVCPYQAISLHENMVGGWHACVDEALCKGCGNCISVCPSNAADSPYRDQAYLEHLLEEVLAKPVLLNPSDS